MDDPLLFVSLALDSCSLSTIFPPSTPCYFAPGRGAGSGLSEEQQELGTIVIARAVIFAASLTYWPSPVASSVPASGAVEESICFDMDICSGSA